MNEAQISKNYEEYVVAHGLERTSLLQGLRRMFSGAPTMLYPGSFIHITPSFYFQHVVYVDQSEFAREFFAQRDAVLSIVNRHRDYPQIPFIHFVAQDFTKPLPFPQASFDVLLALYAGGISRSCVQYVRPGGLVLTNDHHGDARDAAAHPDLTLQAVAMTMGKTTRFTDSELATYLQPSPPRRGRPGKMHSSSYSRSADYYLFRKRS